MNIDGKRYLETYKRLDSQARQQNDGPLDQDRQTDRVQLEGVSGGAEIELHARFWFNQTASVSVMRRPFNEGPATNLNFASPLSMAGVDPFLEVTEDVHPEGSMTFTRTSFRLNRETGLVSNLKSRSLEAGYAYQTPKAYDPNATFKAISKGLDNLQA